MKVFSYRSAVTKIQAAVVAIIIVVAAIAGASYYLTRPAPIPLPQAIKIGMTVTITGEETFFGETTLHGAQLAVKEINEAGGINVQGTMIPLELVFYDDAGDPAESIALSRRLIESDKVLVGILGQGSESATPSRTVWTDAAMPVITLWDVSEPVGASGWLFAFNEPMEVQGWVIGNLSLSLGLKKPATIYTGVDPWETGLAQAFSDYATEGGANVVFTKSVEYGEMEFGPIITQIVASGANSILFTGDYTGCATLAKQARAVGLEVPIFGPITADSTDLIKLGGEDVVGNVYVSSQVDRADPRVVAFDEAYRKEFSDEAWMGFTSVGAYDIIHLLAKVISEKGTEPEQIRKGLVEMHDFIGVRTTYAGFSTGRYVMWKAKILNVSEGEFHVYTTIDTTDFYAEYERQFG